MPSFCGRLGFSPKHGEIKCERALGSWAHLEPMMSCLRVFTTGRWNVELYILHERFESENMAAVNVLRLLLTGSRFDLLFFCESRLLDFLRTAGCSFYSGMAKTAHWPGFCQCRTGLGGKCRAQCPKEDAPTILRYTSRM